VQNTGVVIIKGIVKRKRFKEISNLYATFGMTLVKTRNFKVINLITYGKPETPMIKRSVYQVCRELVLTLIKNFVLNINPKWISFKLSVPYPIRSSIKEIYLTKLDQQIGIKTYVSREVALFNFPTNSLDFTLEYVLKREINNYDLLFTKAIIKSFVSKHTIPVSYKLQNQINTDSYLSDFVPDIKNSYLAPLILKNNKKYPGIYSGSMGTFDYEDNNLILNNWKLRSLPNAEVLHGTAIFSINKFYFQDNTKVPKFGGVYNYWPSYLYQDSIGFFHSAPCRKNLGTYEKAIFIGGIKNWMHFIIEDLPRIIKFDQMNFENNIPLIIQDNLGDKILESIKIISSRPIIQLSPFESVKISTLYYLELDNQLPDTMAGDKVSADRLFDREILFYAKHKFGILKQDSANHHKKILVRREKGLFRVLTNADKLQKKLEEKYGFSTIYLENMKLKSIIQCFQSADIVVGEYGAGLGNMIFMRSGSTLIEIRGPLETSHLEYEMLGKCLDLKYVTVSGTSATFSKFGIARGNFKIDIGMITSALC